jgi:hypothetical protein
MTIDRDKFLTALLAISLGGAAVGCKKEPPPEPEPAADLSTGAEEPAPAPAPEPEAAAPAPVPEVVQTGPTKE